MDKQLGIDAEVNDAVREVLTQDQNKMKEAIQYYEWLDKLIDAMESGEIYKLVPKP
ncbi:HTH-type transcriptional repressor OpcR [compost metagenome]